MEVELGTRLVWMKVLYWYTVLGSGLAGLFVLLAPATFAKAFGMPGQDPFVVGMAGSVWLALGVVALLGLGSPMAFAPILLVQLGYKALWLAFVFLPQALRGALPFYSWLLAAVFASYIVLDLVAIPFRSVKAR